MKPYSDWLRVDLHIHTDKSKQTKENDYKGDFSVEILYQKLIENNVGIFSLTDHNIINIDAYEEYYEKYNNEDDPHLLIGVELDIEVSHEDSTKKYHSLLIFNDNTTRRVKELSEKLENKYSEKGLDDKNRKLTIEEVAELFSEDDFLFIPHADKDNNIVSAYSDVGISEAQKMVLLMPSALEKVTNEERRKGYSKGFSQKLTDSFKRQDDIPYIEFSDNHNINKYPKVHKGGDELPMHSFYYVKGTKNYETLRLAFIDPRSRIMSSAEYDNIDKISNKIEAIKIENEEKVSNTILEFSPHLNVIIGGRSSGKSLLMNVLGKKIDRVSIESYYQINEENFLIKSKVDEDYKMKISLTEEPIYIKQGDIVKYFEDNNLKALAEKSEKKDDYNLSKESIEKQKNKLKYLIEKLLSFYEETVNLSMLKYELHKSTINKIFSSEYTLKFNTEITKEEYLQTNEIESANNLLNNLETFTNEFKNKDIYEFNDDEKEIAESFLNLIRDKKQLISIKKEKDSKKIYFIDNINRLITEKNSNLNQNAQEKIDAQENYKNLINDIGNRFEKFAKLKKSSDKVENFAYEKKEEINISDEVFLVVSVDKFDENENIIEIKKIILDGINSAEYDKSIYINLIGLLDNTKSLKRLPNTSADRLKQKINTQLEILYQKFEKPKDYLRYADGSTSKENSPGLNSENYLKVILKSSSSKIIFIDQPEDNLGNRFISYELVDIIRSMKFKKQIFLVTHNPAIAVYGDAECIIIAENDGNKISYKQIVLEDKEAQKEVCSVLDGGEYIFDNRSKKYNIQRILRETQNG